MDNSHCYANLTPGSFLERAGHCYSNRCAVVLQDRIITFADLLQRTRKMADMLRDLGVAYGDRVGLLAQNSLQSIEAHYAIPSIGGVIVSFNPWLPWQDIFKQMQYCGSKIVLVSRFFYYYHSELFSSVRADQMVVIFDALPGDESGKAVHLYLEEMRHKYDCNIPLDRNIRSENDAVAINFTSGTTGEPKGVVYSHRAAYLHALGQVIMLKLSTSSIYYWSLPMFHVNGWGHMWATVAAGAVQIVDSIDEIGEKNLANRIKDTQATHMAGAPRLLRCLVDKGQEQEFLDGLTILTGGTAPTPDLVLTMRASGANLIHQYGLNETLGPFVVCESLKEWDSLEAADQVKKRLRQGVAAIHAGTGLRVVDRNMNDVPWDGVSQGEVIMSGNTVAQGYYNNTSATDKAFKDGWFHSGDVAVIHPDGYIEVKDRLKDLVFVETEYGWENISSIEIENVISQCLHIKDVAVLGVTDENKRAVIVAAYEKKPGSDVDNDRLRDFCMQRLPYFKVPKLFFEAVLPKTATGKIKKNQLELQAMERLADVESRFVPAQWN